MNRYIIPIIDFFQGFILLKSMVCEVWVWYKKKEIIGFSIISFSVFRYNVGDFFSYK